MQKLSEIGFEAVNIYFSGLCNLRCRYCFQPKIEEISKSINDKIIEWISSGRMEEDIIKYYGEKIKCISLWGGEPSINLPFLEKRLDEIYQKLPFLDTIQYSTNISTKKLTENSINFIRSVSLKNKKFNRNVLVDLQFSIDGPPEINDYNRIGAKADSIMDNITFLIEKIKDLPSKDYNLVIKGTQSADTLSFLIKKNNLLEYYKYFDKYQAKWEKLLSKEKAPSGGTFISLVYPGNYTQKDGIAFKRLLELQNSKEFQKSYKWESEVTFDNQVTSRIKKAFSNLRAGYYRDYKGELLNVCTCSAGKCCGGLTYDSQFHLCQATYMFNEDILKYIEDHNLITEFENKQGFSFRNFKNVIKENAVVSFNDDLKLSRLLYKLNYFNKDLSFKIQYFEIILSELATAGQISKCYLEPIWRDLATAYLLFGGNECPADNIWEFSSPYIRSTSQMKLVFNGAFEYYINNFYKDILEVKIKELL